jgi:hypothetical protein
MLGSLALLQQISVLNRCFSSLCWVRGTFFIGTACLRLCNWVLSRPMYALVVFFLYHSVCCCSSPRRPLCLSSAVLLSSFPNE